MGGEGLDELPADGEKRVQAGQGILKYGPDLRAPDPAHLLQGKALTCRPSNRMFRGRSSPAVPGGR